MSLIKNDISFIDLNRGFFKKKHLKYDKNFLKNLKLSDIKTILDNTKISINNRNIDLFVNCKKTRDSLQFETVGFPEKYKSIMSQNVLDIFEKMNFFIDNEKSKDNFYILFNKLPNFGMYIYFSIYKNDDNNTIPSYVFNDIIKFELYGEVNIVYDVYKRVEEKKGNLSKLKKSNRLQANKNK